MDILTGAMIARNYRRHRSVEFLRFLKRLTPPPPSTSSCTWCSTISPQAGGAPSHPQGPGRQGLAAQAPRIVLHSTPTSASWLNLVERWFAELTRRKLKRSTHRSVVELERDIVTWTQNWNENPNPSSGPRLPTRSSKSSPATVNESTTHHTSVEAVDLEVPELGVGRERTVPRAGPFRCRCRA